MFISLSVGKKGVEKRWGKLFCSGGDLTSNAGSLTFKEKTKVLNVHVLNLAEIKIKGK